MENFTKRTGFGGGTLWMATWAVLMGTVACGPMDYTSAPVEVTTHEQELAGENGLATNGLATNGLATNGFSEWFTQDTQMNAMVMKYLVRCAVPEGETRSHQDPSTGIAYTWQGSLGLAPDWSRGKRMNEREQQLVSACMAAHANKYGKHVQLSVLGRTAQLQTIPYTSEELQTFARREACFFGNLFKNEGLFAGVDGEYLNDGESSPRACGLTTKQGELESQCSPIVHVESCETYCKLDPTGLFYTECTYNGRTYLPLTTRIRTDDVYTCGDGVCQFTESCGDGSEANNCMNDCGACQ
ncbi:MAG TPA: hypothetical protein VF815_15195 [Myxococcaceae bacterium]